MRKPRCQPHAGLVMWDPGSNSDRADLHVAVVYPPAFLMGVGIAASGEFWHALLKRNRRGSANSARD
jgi:hypothetical protein